MPELTLSLWPYSSSCKSNGFFLNLVLSPDPAVYPTAKGNDEMSTGKEDQKEEREGSQVEGMTFGLRHQPQSKSLALLESQLADLAGLQRCFSSTAVSDGYVL